MALYWMILYDLVLDDLVLDYFVLIGLVFDDIVLYDLVLDDLVLDDLALYDLVLDDLVLDDLVLYGIVLDDLVLDGLVLGDLLLYDLVLDDLELDDLVLYDRGLDDNVLDDLLLDDYVDEETIAALREATVLFADNQNLPKILGRLPKLQWVQCTFAGVELLTWYFKDKPKPTIPVTRMSSEKFSQMMAEHTIGWIINHERGWLECRRHQVKCKWVKKTRYPVYRSLWGLTVGVMGLGTLGKVVAKFLKMFHSCVHAYTSAPPSPGHRSSHVDKYWHTGELHMFLKQCDYIINVLPSTPSTRWLLGGDTLENAKRNAVFINAGRGDVISEGDIIKALDAGWLSCAILDVFISEPLSPQSPLWKHPKVVITPHTAANIIPEDIAETFALNFRRYQQGLPPLFQIDWNKCY
ncbi:glyoxylate/hydroxypyruvate reductase A-like [Panulirus ornatus]|uniref:glyoxylate/hydroxypyruvate reductase A-like n=1 Tax=Panulirus ornatus TaxID=150431 RepID=UPI003A8419E5